MPWYQDPAITGLVGAIVGAIIGAVISASVPLYIWLKDRRLKRLECVIKTPASLLTVSDAIKNKLNVLYEGNQVSSVVLFPIKISNTGTLAIQDQPIIIKLDDNARIVDYKIETEPKIGFGKIESIVENNSLKLKVELFNPKDEMQIEIVSVNNSSEKVEVGLKNQDVEVQMYSQDQIEAFIKDTEGMRSWVSSIPITGPIAAALTDRYFIERYKKRLNK